LDAYFFNIKYPSYFVIFRDSFDVLLSGTEKYADLVKPDRQGPGNNLGGFL
jgi:hypothetical protein